MIKLTVIGNVTKDAELRTTQGGDHVLSFSVAQNDRRTKAVTYVDCSIWGKLGQSMQPYLKKGQKVYCEGEFSTREYDSKTYIQCRVRDVELLGQRQESAHAEDRKAITNISLEDEIPW